jgi:hypothetical protein
MEKTLEMTQELPTNTNIFSQIREFLSLVSKNPSMFEIEEGEELGFKVFESRYKELGQSLIIVRSEVAPNENFDHGLSIAVHNPQTVPSLGIDLGFQDNWDSLSIYINPPNEAGGQAEEYSEIKIRDPQKAGSKWIQLSQSTDSFDESVGGRYGLATTADIISTVHKSMAAYLNLLQPRIAEHERVQIPASSTMN